MNALRLALFLCIFPFVAVAQDPEPVADPASTQPPEPDTTTPAVTDSAPLAGDPAPVDPAAVDPAAVDPAAVDPAPPTGDPPPSDPPAPTLGQGERMAYGGFQATPPAPPAEYSAMEWGGFGTLLAGGLASITGALLWAEGFDLAGPITTGLGAATSAAGIAVLYIDSLEPSPQPPPDAQTFWISLQYQF